MFNPLILSVCGCERGVNWIAIQIYTNAFDVKVYGIAITKIQIAILNNENIKILHENFIMSKKLHTKKRQAMSDYALLVGASRKPTQCKHTKDDFSCDG